jgi:lactate dehydrogenase-like 2-hydroxyacid dehydrogenase
MYLDYLIMVILAFKMTQSFKVPLSFKLSLRNKQTSLYAESSSSSSSSSSSHFDYLVIGGGSGGIASARRAAGYGAKVCVVERSALVNLYLILFF